MGRDLALKGVKYTKSIDTTNKYEKIIFVKVANEQNSKKEPFYS